MKNCLNKLRNINILRSDSWKLSYSTKIIKKFCAKYENLKEGGTKPRKKRKKELCVKVVGFRKQFDKLVFRIDN